MLHYQQHFYALRNRGLVNYIFLEKKFWGKYYYHLEFGKKWPVEQIVKLGLPYKTGKLSFGEVYFAESL